jgi:hypothetical protein
LTLKEPLENPGHGEWSHAFTRVSGGRSAEIEVFQVFLKISFVVN